MIFDTVAREKKLMPTSHIPHSYSSFAVRLPSRAIGIATELHVPKLTSLK